ncbi:MAG: hypothetical protein HOB16_07300 [Flavobacteriaceae bacterium]|nr:hypothetical protein [Flavobacteriaceae bacterium]
MRNIEPILKLFRDKEHLDSFLNSNKMKKFLDENRITKSDKTFNPEFKTIGSAKLYSIKFGVASCKNQTFAHGKLMITYAEDEIINEK